ncbi:sulfurtransferase complex subunit TusC [uncultured Thiothrix sp.]|uniref:sulfurtransferase complex subunit TusC n=1 Tax=uncultured Thiothrix sp. TaxID=223185 RepID=UPI002626BEB0|nr:sulfurtransferase complex subunit TusC [uncultured Thiothrix sp.]
MAKKFLYLNRKAPYGTVYALESLEVVLIAAAFEQEVSLAFLDDGVYQIAKGQNPKAAGMKNFSPTYNALGDYGITQLYVERESLVERGLTEEDLMPIVYEDENDEYAEKPSVQVISRAEMSQIMAEQDVTLSF